MWHDRQGIYTNTMQASDINNLLRFGERIQLEVEKAESDIPETIWETYSSFANTQGGYILLGIFGDLKEPDLSKRFIVTGVKDARRILSDFWNIINSDKVSANILRDEDTEIVDVDGKNVVSIHVPQADYRQKPIYINGNVFRNTLKRTLEDDYHCTENEIRGMIHDASESGSDGMLIENYDMNDIDLDSLHAYRRVFENRHPGHAYNASDDKNFLRELGGYTLQDR